MTLTLPTQVKRTQRIVTLDIERVPGRAIHTHRGITMDGPFWDLSGWKSTIGYRLPTESVVEWPRTICVAWRVFGQKRVEFAAEWQDGGWQGMAEKVWQVFDQADLIVGHNASSFDVRKLKADWKMAGLTPPRPWKVVDTLTVARREFGFESNTLDSLCQRLGVPGKVDKYDPECAKAAVAGDKTAQKRLRVYNQGDIEASEALWLSLLPWMPNHPHVNTVGEDLACNRCGNELERVGSDYRAVVLDYPLYRCTVCQGWSRGAFSSARASRARGVR